MNRRGFLKTTVYAGAVAMGARTASAQASPAERVRVAVMGTGGRGASLMKTAAELPNVEIATVCDVDVRAMDRAADEGRNYIVLDLGGVEYMSSAGLREMVRVLKRVKRSGGDLRIANPSERVREVLELAGLDTIFEIYSTQVEAVGSF